MPRDFRDVDPRELRVPSSRSSGADPFKLQRQIAQFGASAVGMPPLWVYESSDGFLVAYNGVTRATRIAKLPPGSPRSRRGHRKAAPGVCRRPENWRFAPMIQPIQQQLIRELTAICELSPDVRFGQLLANLGFLAEDHPGRSLWDIDDQELLDVMRRHLGDLTRRQSHVA